MIKYYSEKLHGSIEDTVKVQADATVNYDNNSGLAGISVDGCSGNDGNGNLVFGEPWSGYVTRPDAISRYRVMALASNTSVKAVDNPGFGDSEPRLRHAELKAIRDGNFDENALKQWDALGELEGDVSLIGYSMGAHAVVSLAKNAPEALKIDRLVLWESAPQKQSLVSLLGKFATENKTWSRYFDENQKCQPMPGPSLGSTLRIARRPSVHISYPIGMTQGRLLEDLVLAREKESIHAQTEVLVLNGSESRVSPDDQNDELAVAIDRLGIQSIKRISFEGESHGMIDSQFRVAEALTKIY